MFGLLYAVAAGLFLCMIPIPRVDNHLLGSDGGYYYSYMRSWWLDNDTDIRNDIAAYNSRMDGANPNRLHPAYDRSIGPSLLWSPFFLAGRAIALTARKAGFRVAADGFSFVEEAAVSLGSMAYGVLGLYLCFLVLRNRTSGTAAMASVLVLALSSFVFYYILFEPSMGHAVELFTVSIFVWACVGRDPVSLRDWCVAGAAGGLMCMVRWQNAVFLLLLPMVLLQGGLPRERTGWRRLAVSALTTALPLLSVASLQSMFWMATLNTPLTVPQGRDFLTPLDPHVTDFLFSTRHGLLCWHPVFAAASIGILLVRPIRLAVCITLLIVLQVYVCSIVSEWWCADSFGMRRMTGAVPLFAFGLAFLFQKLTRPAFAGVAALLSLLLISWNLLFMAQYRLGLIPPGEALSWRQMTVEKAQVFSKGLQRLRGQTPTEPTGAAPQDRADTPPPTR